MLRGWAGYIDPDERTAEEWWERVGDLGLDVARTAFALYVEFRLEKLYLEIVKAARWYAESGLDHDLLVALDNLGHFQEDHALDNTGKPLERGGAQSSPTGA